jgi:hypothetical protein
MADFTSLNLQYNKGSDGTPDWTGTAIAFGGTSGANEMRWCASGAGGASIGSASWPYVTRPSSGTAAIAELWAFTSDTSGTKVATYDGSNTASRVLRWNWDNTGTFAAAPQFSAFGDNTHTTPSAGTQPGGQSGSPIVNGQSSDTSSTSYLKINAYGNGVTAGGVQHTPSSGAAGTTLAATSGTAGAVTPASTPAWLTTWQSAQGWTAYILNGAIPQAVTAGQWYWTMALYTGANMSLGSAIQPVLTFQYSYT